MPIIIAIETFLIFIVLFFERFIAPSTSIASASSAFVTSTALHKLRSFGLRRPLNSCLAVLVEEMQGLLAVLGVSVVTGGEVIIQVHF